MSYLNIMNNVILLQFILILENIAVTTVNDQTVYSLFAKDECSKESLSDVTICINPTRTKQTIIGFGGSFTDASGINMDNLSPDCKQNLMNSYFSTKGLEYNIGRVPIGGCDFSTRPYTYHDGSPNDFKLENFKLAMEDYKYKIPMIKAANKLSGREIRLVASAWSAPAWMKINGQLNGFGFLKGFPGNKYYQTWAEYYARFLKEYANNSIQFWAVTAQNEPTDGFYPYFPFNSMGFTPNMQRIFVNKNLGPTLENAGFSHVKIFILDDNRPFLLPYLFVIMLDPRSKKYVSGAALHWYFDTLITSKVLDIANHCYPNQPLLMTEVSFLRTANSGDPVQLGNWDRAVTYASRMIENLNHWVTGWIDWNLALDPDGGPNWAKFNLEGTIIVNKTSDEFYKQPIYYALGHFSKFVPPDSKVLKIDINLLPKVTGISAIAFITPQSSIVLIILNSQTNPVSTDICVNGPDIVRFNVKIPGDSIQTYIWWQN